jgi:two-component system, cell cycle response regulator CpdR
MPPTILLVDDDPGILGVGAMMLEDCGCVVLTAASGGAALAKLKDNPEISHLLTDVQMPGMNGYELAHRATTIRPGLEVIVTSGTDRMGRGFVFLPKPFSMTELQGVFGVGCGGLMAQP